LHAMADRAVMGTRRPLRIVTRPIADDRQHATVRAARETSRGMHI
jgi:hypothetical protein